VSCAYWNVSSTLIVHFNRHQVVGLSESLDDDRQEIF
jgi:hypothetical protein